VIEETLPVDTVPAMPPVQQPIAADNSVNRELAIKEIFNKPSGAPDMVASETPAPSVMPLIKSMLKKGLLPSWVKADADENINSGLKE
jgi:hypothetical protein